jgi:hypothetical protein
MSETSDDWRTILEWPNYRISRRGEVVGRHGEIRTFPIKGYLSFNVMMGKRRKSLRVHREVMRAFVGDRPGLEVRHLNGDPLDCRLENLCYGTRIENEADKLMHGTSLDGSRNHQAKINEDQVQEIRSPPLPGAALARQFNVSQTTVSNIRLGRNWRCIL